ncbi:MAG: caspase family protein [Planktothrix sp.]
MGNIKRQALVVGINRYSFLRDTATGLLLNRKKPASDAEEIAQLLEKPTGELGWSVRRLPEVSEGGKFRIGDTATVSQEKLTKAILSLFQPEPHYPTEVGLLFFAGHGLRRQQVGQTEGFLATSDSNGKSNWGVSLTWLREVLLNSSMKQQIV